MQILNLTYLGKICPEILSGIVFVEEEWKVLCCCARKNKEIPESYSLKEAIYDLGVLGGTKGAPSDGMPGVRSIWQGLDVLYSQRHVHFQHGTLHAVVQAGVAARNGVRVLGQGSLWNGTS